MNRRDYVETHGLFRIKNIIALPVENLEVEQEPHEKIVRHGYQGRLIHSLTFHENLDTDMDTVDSVRNLLDELGKCGDQDIPDGSTSYERIKKVLTKKELINKQIKLHKKNVTFINPLIELYMAFAVNISLEKIKKELIDNPINLFEMKEFVDNIFDVKFDLDFVKEHLKMFPTNLFEMKDVHNRPIILQDKFDLDFVKEHLKMFPTNLFESKDAHNRPIILQDKFDLDFIKEHLEIFPTNLFEFKDVIGRPIISYNKFDINFIKEHLKIFSTNLFDPSFFNYINNKIFSDIDFIKEHILKYPTNLFELYRYNTILFEDVFTEEFLVEHLELFPTNLFKMANGNSFRFLRTCSQDFILKHLVQYPTNIFKLNYIGNESAYYLIEDIITEHILFDYDDHEILSLLYDGPLD
jgi:hypothetical protein